MRTLRAGIRTTCRRSEYLDPKRTQVELEHVIAEVQLRLPEKDPAVRTLSIERTVELCGELDRGTRMGHGGPRGSVQLAVEHLRDVVLRHAHEIVVRGALLQRLDGHC